MDGLGRNSSIFEKKDIFTNNAGLALKMRFFTLLLAVTILTTPAMAADKNSFICDKKGETLISAISKSDMAQVKKSVTEGANINCRQKSGHSPLFWAVGKRNLELVTFLLKHGADPDQPAKNAGITPLMMAANYGDYEIVKSLLDAKVDVFAKNRYGKTALFYAIGKKQKKIEKLLRKSMSKASEK